MIIRAGIGRIRGITGSAGYDERSATTKSQLAMLENEQQVTGCSLVFDDGASLVDIRADSVVCSVDGVTPLALGAFQAVGRSPVCPCGTGGEAADVQLKPADLAVLGLASAAPSRRRGCSRHCTAAADAAVGDETTRVLALRLACGQWRGLCAQLDHMHASAPGVKNCMSSVAVSSNSNPACSGIPRGRNECVVSLCRRLVPGSCQLSFFRCQRKCPGYLPDSLYMYSYVYRADVRYVTQRHEIPWVS